MVELSTVVFIAIIIGVWLFGFVACGVLASGTRSDLEVENQLLSGSLREKEDQIRELEFLVSTYKERQEEIVL